MPSPRPVDPHSPARRFVRAVLGLALLTGTGTAGYMAIEGMRPVDALYMTVMTISTVGFGEVVPLSQAGRLYTTALIIAGVGSGLYLLTILGELVIEGRLREFFGRTSMQRTIDHLRDHVVICGFGRFGRTVFDELRRKGEAVVVVDSDPALEPALQKSGARYLIGSAIADDVLAHAGIARARALVVATASDPDNVFVTLSAREQNPTLRIHARGESEAGLRHLRLAGADQVVSAYQSGGMRVAAAILRPSVVDFLEVALPGRGEAIALEEIRVDAGMALVGRDVGAIERERPRVRIVGLKRGETPTVIAPDAATRVEAGDLLVIVGARAGVEELLGG
jgi:voltage-gated potassium channel